MNTCEYSTAIPAPPCVLADALVAKDALIVELQHQIRTLRHEANGWKAKYQNEKLLRERERGQS